MTEKNINILGEDIKLHFNMAVEIIYEEITGEPFTLEALKKQKNSMALYLAAIITCNHDTKITFDRLVQEATAQDITLLASTVIELMTEWMKIPDVVQKNDDQPKAEENQEGEKPKNPLPPTSSTN